MATFIKKEVEVCLRLDGITPLFTDAWNSCEKCRKRLVVTMNNFYVLTCSHALQYYIKAGWKLYD